MSHLCLTNALGALITINASNIMIKTVSSGSAFPATWQWETFHVWTSYKNIHPSKLFEGKGTITKRAPLYGFCAVAEGNWLMNLNYSCRACVPEFAEHVEEREACCCYCTGAHFPRCCAVLCGEVVIDSTGNNLFIKTHISNMWRKVTRGKGKNLISSVCPKWLRLPPEYNVYYLFMLLRSRPVDLWITSFLISDIEIMIQHCTFPLTLSNTEYIEDVYQMQPTENKWSMLLLYVP